MPDRFEQIPLGEMERGLARTIAVIAHSPLAISKLTGIRFETGHDGFAYFQGALLKTPNNKQFSLRQYRQIARHYPNKTELIGSEFSNNPVCDLSQFLEALAFSPASLDWALSLFWGEYKQLSIKGAKLTFKKKFGEFRLVPHHITDGTGIAFEKVQADGPNVSQCALLEMPDGHRFLLRHCGDTLSARIELFGSENCDISNTELDRFFSATKISRDEYFAVTRGL